MASNLAKRQLRFHFRGHSGAAYTATSILRITMPAAFSTATSMYSRTATRKAWNPDGESLLGLLKRHPVLHLPPPGSSGSRAVNERFNFLTDIRALARVDAPDGEP